MWDVLTHPCPKSIHCLAKPPLGLWHGGVGCVGVVTDCSRCYISLNIKRNIFLSRDPDNHIVVFWHISNMALMISWDQIYYNTPMFCIAAIFVKVGCYNIWAKICCSGCSPLAAWGKIIVKKDYCILTTENIINGLSMSKYQIKWQMNAAPKTWKLVLWHLHVADYMLSFPFC